MIWNMGFSFTKPDGNNITYIKSVAILHASNHKLADESHQDFMQNSNNIHIITRNKEGRYEKHIFRTVDLTKDIKFKSLRNIMFLDGKIQYHKRINIPKLIDKF